MRNEGWLWKMVEIGLEKYFGCCCYYKFNFNKKAGNMLCAFKVRQSRSCISYMIAYYRITSANE